MRRRHVAQHIFGHQLRHAIGVDRPLGGILPYGRDIGRAISRGGRGEDEMRHAGGDRAVDQVARLRAVVVIIFRSEEHTSELQSLMRISYAVFCLKKKKTTTTSNR